MKKFVLGLLICLMSVSLVHSQNKETFTIATYNLRFNNPKDGINAWPNRKDLVKSLIRFHGFDLFGTQEGLIDQLNDLAEMSEFSFVGKGRDDGKNGGEHSAIFYKKNRFELLDRGDFWLSETPDEPSFGWDAACRRICSWAKLKDKETSKMFYFFSVHFDHKGVEARVNSGSLMVGKMQEIAGNYPVICVGDFNSTPGTQQIQKMKSLLQDAHDVSELSAYGPEGTANGFRFDAALDKRIDYIFTSNEVRVLKYGVLSDSYQQRYPSDHLPVVANVEIK